MSWVKDSPWKWPFKPQEAYFTRLLYNLPHLPLSLSSWWGQKLSRWMGINTYWSNNFVESDRMQVAIDTPYIPPAYWLYLLSPGALTNCKDKCQLYSIGGAIEHGLIHKLVWKFATVQCWYFSSKPQLLARKIQHGWLNLPQILFCQVAFAQITECPRNMLHINEELFVILSY